MDNGYWLHSVILRGGLGAVWDSWWLVGMGIIRTKRLGAENKRWVVYVFFWLPIRQGLYSLSERESVLAAPLPSHCSTAGTAACHLSPAAGRLITLKSCLLQCCSTAGWVTRSHNLLTQIDINRIRETSHSSDWVEFSYRIVRRPASWWLLLHLQGSLCSPDTININLGVSPNTQSHPRYQLLQLTCAASCNRSRTSQKAFNNNKKIPYSIFVFLIVRNNQSWMIFLTG